jgi:hypothetical protein
MSDGPSMRLSLGDISDRLRVGRLLWKLTTLTADQTHFSYKYDAYVFRTKTGAQKLSNKRLFFNVLIYYLNDFKVA